MAATHPHRPAAWRELRVFGLLAALWLGSWLLLSVATWIAGGHPTASPLRLIDPAAIGRRLAEGNLALRWWVLVDPTSPIVAWRFWVGLSTAVLTIGGCALSVRRAVTTGSRPWLTALLTPGQDVVRSAQWAGRGDLRRLRARRRRAGVFIIGARGRRTLTAQPETSVLAIGPTRSGKTAGLIVPNLLEWDGPAIATSTKSELVDITAGHRQSIGPVYVYDPTGEIGSRSVTWSPITGCENLDRAWMVASWLCAALQQGGGRGDTDWLHWAESGKLLIAPLLYVAAVTGHSIVDVRTWIHSFDLATPQALLEELLLDAGPAGDSDPVRAMSMLASVDQRPDRERSTVFSTVMRVFNVFTERAVAESALSSRFDADDLLRRRGTLYLCTPRQAPERIASLFVGILMTVVTAAYAMSDRNPGRRPHATLGLFLDELANVVPIEDLPALASQGAGRGVMLMSIVQDLSQLRTRYGVDRANTILNNHACKVILPGLSDPESAEVLGRLIGRSAFTDLQVSLDASGRESRSYSTRHDLLATPDTLRRLAPGTAS